MQVVKNFCDGCKISFKEFEQIKLTTDNLDLLKPKRMTDLQIHVIANQLAMNITGLMDDILLCINDNEYIELITAIKEEIVTQLRNQ